MHLTPTKRARVCTLRDAGMTFREIRNILGGSVSSVHDVYSKYHEDRDFYATVPNRGRKPILTPLDCRFAARLIRSGKCTTAANVQHRYFAHLSASLMRRILAEEGLHGR